MKKSNQLMLLLALGCQASLTLASDASVFISSPNDGAVFNNKSKIEIAYEVTPGEKGDHVHLYVDEKEAVVLRKLKGVYSVEPLTTGKHSICIKIVNKGHTPIGVQSCTNITVQQ